MKGGLDVKLRWHGHACFSLISSDETRILTDPFDEHVGYELPRVEADVVTISHGHFDHCYVTPEMGNPEIVRNPGTTIFRDVRITGVPSFHDNNGGKTRGTNIMFSFKIDDIQIAHLGDLGHTLGPEHVMALGHPQVLLIPVGGTYTIDWQEASRVVETLEPKIVIPMHYKTAALSFPLDTVDNFLQDKVRVRRESYSTIEITPDNLPADQEIIVLSYI
jgi:L-ascorbate metabolism protein UlaG (beta-lactamase superfamily)